MDKLIKLITLHSKMYYEGLSELNGIPRISDEEFDDLVDKLKEKDPNCYILSLPGYGYAIGSSKYKVNHELAPITGISNKTKNYHFYKTLSNEDYVLTPKLDGTSVVITYDNEFIKLALSRGSGTSGSDILDIISQIPSVPNKINYKDKLIIRGELVNTSNEGNIRNQSNGLIMRKDYLLTDDEKDSFLFIPYSILNKQFNSKIEELELLGSLGFNKIPHLKVHMNDEWNWIHDDKDYESIVEYLSSYMNHDLPLDGIIFEKNSPNYRSSDTSPFTRKLIAYKFDSTSETTEVVDIKWKASKYGKLFPVLKLKSVNLDGAKVSKVSGGSYSELVKRGLGIGAKVVVIRSGGVIPYIKSVVESSSLIELPNNSYVNGAHLFIKDFKIDESRLIKNICYKNIPDGFSKSFLNKVFIDNPQIENSIDEFKLFIDNINANGYRKSKNINTPKRIKALIQLASNIKNYKINLSRLLNLSSINGLGKEYLKSLSTEYGSIDLLINDLENNPNLIKKLSNVTVKDSLVKNIQNLKIIDEFFKDNDQLVESSDPQDPEDSTKYSVVLTNFTGSPINKKDFGIKFDYLKMINDVKNCDLLIYHKSGSSKMNIAAKLGKKILSITEFLKLSKDEVINLIKE